jgi:hypothetical protein
VSDYHAVSRITANKLGAKFSMSPATADGSWPCPKDTLRSSRELSSSMAELKHSELPEKFRGADFGAIGRLVDDHVGERADNSTLPLMVIAAHEDCRRVA